MDKNSSNALVVANKQRVLITPDLVIDLYLTSKKLSGTQKEKLIDKCKVLSQNLGKFIDI